MAQQEQLRVGIIGCGAGIFHLEGYQNEPRAKVVALAGLDTDRCEMLAKKFDVPRIYRDYQDLLADDDIDAVSIAVPNVLHMPVALAAFEAGKHVLIEKPLARNAEEGVKMVEAAERHGKVLGVSFQRRTRHDVELLRQQVADGAFGRIYYSKAWWMRRSGIPGLGSWFTSKEGAGGGPLIDLGVHVLDMILHVLGNPKVTSVTASTYAEIGPQGKGGWVGRRSSQLADGQAYEVEDLATAFMRFEDGGTLLLEASWAAFTEMKDDFGIQLYGSQGGARIFAENYALVDTLEVYSGFGDTTMDSKPRLVETEGHGAIIRDFVSAILDGTPMSPDGREGLDRVRLIDAIYRSAELGHEIVIDEEITGANLEIAEGSTV
ncbi:MAG TPA: Gfo/Idh/MocA family oxidoreductase [Thermomicrobiales bacterium]|nr:Gfo/Idh/MocA family oxidoreductase [Thermomicrobiales bacterium]